MVSVCMITYNHEKFIYKAIKGVLMQETNFPIELVIGEDCSTDNTRVICEEYAKKHAEIIRLLPSEKNLGMMPNFIRTLQACSGKYIAICEGDDYWTDPYKLQKQVDFLEANPEYSFCFHNVNWVNERDELVKIREEFRNTTCYLQEEIFYIHIQTPSLVMRNIIHDFPKEFQSVPHGDAFLVALLATKGKCADLGFIGAHYRVHSGGVYSGKSRTKKDLNTIKTRRVMLASKYFSPKFKQLIKNQMKRKKKNYLKNRIKKLDIIGFLRILFS